MTPKEKLDKIVEDSKGQVAKTLENIQHEHIVRKDTIVKPAKIDFGVDENGIRPIVAGQPFGLTDHSENQMLQRAQVPKNYANKLMELGEFGLLRESLNTLTGRLNQNGVFLRTVEDTIKGWLSPSYRPMDAAPVFEAFIESALKEGFVPQRARNTDYRYQVNFLHPEVFEVGEQALDHVVYGVNITTGDYGGTSLQVGMFILRVFCTNLATGLNMLRKVHLGKRMDLGLDDIIQLSERTHKLDTATIASGIRDIVHSSKEHIKVVDEGLRKAVAEGIKPATAYINIKDKFGKEVAEKVKNLYESRVGVESLPSGEGAWRWSNAISLIAKEQKADTQLDMEQEALRVLAIKA